jgi:hypothetical protein
MFRQGLKDLGYVEDRDFHITYRSSDGYQDRLPALAEELVRLNPDVLIGAGLDAVVALRNVTQTIPIVSATLADAVHLGLIANEARPTGNVTGIPCSRHRWRAWQLWCGSGVVLAPRRLLCGQDLAWRSTGRFAGRVSDQDAAGDQPQNGQGTRPHCALVSARSGRRGDRMKRRTFAFSAEPQPHGRFRQARSNPQTGFLLLAYFGTQAVPKKKMCI